MRRAVITPVGQNLRRIQQILQLLGEFMSAVEWTAKEVYPLGKVYLIWQKEGSSEDQWESFVNHMKVRNL